MFRPLPPGAKVIFVHIPKTGGTSFGRALASEYSHDIRFLEGGVRLAHEQIRTMTRAELEPYRAFSGHLPFGLHRDLPFACGYVTFLRDPTERLVSHYFHILEDPEHYLHETLVARRVSLLDYVSSDLTVELDNHQTRMVAGIEDADRPINTCDESLLRLARTNIERHFHAVGVQEHFDDSLLLARSCLGWREDTFYTAERVHASRPRGRAIDHQVRTIVEERNRFDLALHRDAVAHLRRELELRGAAFFDADRPLRRERRQHPVTA
ncbi:MAG: sulfotransferase family 2 domain-containing protein, partial [Phycisphaerales bacterium]|nr:sulfotransferase family 2 domain-containing protein [Phycisphaerales bacterium]